MREITDAALRFPTATFTAALVLVVGFWTLILLGPSARDRRTRRAEDPSHVRATPVIAEASLVIALAWILSLGGSLLLRPHEAAQPLAAVLAALLLVTSLALATLAARRVTRGRRRPR
ncbi:hypothetical protein [Streptomyces cylindrosporus]|uniref:Integral membrane protein n=1 Tax=Streptomyces cylindrosporus TaxID=2927583 RepID=A0ABS9YHH0_9ACTN|nr:hypothetical protein [Streptomyces cylindrosporus]MCI3276697.1 hypothetical protein [Streptomyces cylindrosporus]